MNELAEKRRNKLLHTVKKFIDGATDSQIAEKLDWTPSAVRSIASALKNRGKLEIKVVDKDTWVFFPLYIDDVSTVNKEDDRLKEATDSFGRSIAELIYVIFSNRK
jgi:predicted ArsR family transcriptional regulator